MASNDGTVETNCNGHEPSQRGGRRDCEGEGHGLSVESAAPGRRPQGGVLRPMGFTAEEWEILAGALRTLAATTEVAKQVDSPHGTKYIIDGPLATPIGKTPWVRTVWIIDQGADTPRLVSAYPHKKGDGPC